MQGNFLGWEKDLYLDICGGCKVVYTCKLSTSCILMILLKRKIKAYSEISLILYLKQLIFDNVKTIVIYLGKHIELCSAEAYTKKKAQSYPKLWPMIVHL